MTDASGARMPTVEQVTIFLASPGDVAQERQYAREVIEELNRTLGPALAITLRIVGWEFDTIPGFGKDPQGFSCSGVGRIV